MFHGPFLLVNQMHTKNGSTVPFVAPKDLNAMHGSGDVSLCSMRDGDLALAQPGFQIHFINAAAGCEEEPVPI